MRSAAILHAVAFAALHMPGSRVSGLKPREKAPRCNRSAHHHGPFNNERFSHWGITHGRLPPCTWDSCFKSKLCGGRCGVGDDGRLQPVRVYTRGENEHGPFSSRESRHGPVLHGLSWAEVFAASERAGLLKRVKNASEACVVIEPLALDSRTDTGLAHANRLLFHLRGDETVAEHVKEAKRRGWRGSMADFVGRAMVMNDNWVRQVSAMPSSGVSPLG